MNKMTGTKPRYKVGDWVSFPFGAMKIVARIIEDRGPLGAGGRRLYRIETTYDDGEVDRFEVREEHLSLAAPPVPAKAS